MITHPGKDMMKDLIEIWKKSFGDADWYIDFFFKHRVKPENTLVYLVEGKPVSMLMLFPAKLRGHEIFYVYGVATLPDYRRQGFSTSLLSYVNKNLPENVLGTFLRPATDSLFTYYKKQGYETAFYVKTLDLTISELNEIKTPIEFSKISPGDYKRLRDSSFKNGEYIEWDVDAVEYAMKENELVGGKTLLITYGKDKGIIMCRTWENKLYVKETTLDSDILKAALKRIVEQEHTQNCNVRLHPNSALGKEPEKFAMIYGKNNSIKGYFNLAKD